MIIIRQGNIIVGVSTQTVTVNLHSVSAEDSTQTMQISAVGSELG